MANLPSFLKEDFGIDSQSSKLIDIAVIGSRGCGKTSFVQNAVRSFFPTQYNEAFLQPGEKTPCTFVKLQPRAGMWQSARLIEIDLGVLKYGRMQLKDLPRFDGVVLCYDSLVPASYEALPNLMLGFHRLGTPFIVVGCRADLPQQVSPEAVADDCSHLEAGLVLTTTTTQDGVKKMQGAFSWIVKAVLRRRDVVSTV